MPLLISGLVYPFYIGFIRGAILLNDVMLERARGWVSFMAGVSFYFYATAAIVGQLLVALPVIIAGGWLTVQTARWFSRSTGFRPSDSDLGLMGASAGATIFLSSFALFVELYPKLWSNSQNITSPPYLWGLLPFIWALPLFIIEERVIRRVIATGWKLLKFSSKRDLSEPGFTRPLSYLIFGTMECWLMGIRSDWLATIAYFVSILLSFAAFNPGVAGLIAGLSGLLLLCFSCFRFLKCKIRLRRTLRA